jgi:hypothetical protein
LMRAQLDATPGLSAFGELAWPLLGFVNLCGVRHVGVVSRRLSDAFPNALPESAEIRSDHQAC